MLATVRYALRQLRNSPGFALTAILTLALGVGATTAIFSVLDAVLLQPLPFPQPDRLMALSAEPWGALSLPTAQDWQSRGHSFSSIAVYRGWSPIVRTAQGAQHPQVTLVSQNFFSTLGMGMMLGHDFARTGVERDCLGQAVLSDGLWRRLGGGTTLGERTLEINRSTYRVIGVLSAAEPVEGPGALDRPDIYVPLGCDPRQQDPEDRGQSSYQALGRLRPGVTLAQARLDIDAVQRSLRHDYPGQYPPSYAAPMTPLVDAVAGADTRKALLISLAACGLLLLIACANLINLLLARNTRRRFEFATRATLGASMSQLLRQLLVESAVLALFGAGGGVALAVGVVHSLQHAAVLHVARLGHASLSPRVMLFVVFVSGGVTILLTLLPALRTLRPALLTDLAQGRRAGSASSSLRRAGRILVAAQVSLALVLVACSGWMITSVYRLLHQPLGFNPAHLLLVGIDTHGNSAATALDMPTGAPADAEAAARVRVRARLDQVVATLSHLPGVESAAATSRYPLGGWINRYDFCSDAHPDLCHAINPHSPDNSDITPGYFGDIGQPLFAGRDFTAADDGGNPVVIVNRALAAQEWPGQQVLGKRIYSGQIHAWATVVGVAGDVHNFDLSTPPAPNLYLPFAGSPRTDMVVVLRTSGNPDLLEATIRKTLQTELPDVALTRLQSMHVRMEREVAERSFLMQVSAAFGAIALFLAILGTYGLLAYEVSLREKEIGIRLALGSTREAIVQLLLAQESRWVLLGAGCGLFAAALTGYALRAQFYQPRASSLPVLAASLALLVLPALVAIALPAKRAAQLDPVQTLRNE